MLKHSDMSDSGPFEADAEQEGVAGLPADEENEEGFEPDGDEAVDNDADEQEPDGDEEGAPEDDSEGDDAAPAKQPPKKDKQPQSKKDDHRYATARKDADQKRRAAEKEAADAKARMDAFAKSYGYESFEAMEHAEQVRRYKENGFPDGAATEMASLRRELEAAKAELAAIRKEREATKLIEQLYDEFPETRSMEELPPEVQEAVYNGETPANAYRAWENKQLKEQLRVLQQRRKNNKKAVGSARGAATRKPPKDDFLSGLFT